MHIHRFLSAFDRLTPESGFFGMLHKGSSAVVGLMSVLVAAAWIMGTAAARGEDESLESADADPPIPIEVTYTRHIRPIFAEHCFACHGPDGAARQADLRLDVRDEAIAGGAIVPGDPEASELIRRIRLPEDDDEAMPPAEGHKRLRGGERKLLTRWIADGADYEEHWAFIPPLRPPLPEVSTPGWVKNPIDRFILASLDSAGLQPSPEADRRTLARRAALDLLGLPPTVEQVEAFVADESPEAYERYVDTLLHSTRYGEHRGRYWLDYARYGDTHGIHFDNFREMWSYRNWVIDAFNRNLPFDQFTIEQLAGDLLPEPTLDQLIATGFHRCNITTNEGGIIDEEYKVLYARDRTETTGLVWMAMTLGCAVCHDHKFDPVSQDEFYSLSAFFNNTTQAVRDGNVPNTPPIVPVPRFEERERFQEVMHAVGETTRELEETREAERPRFDELAAELDSDGLLQKVADEGLLVHAMLGEGAGNAAAVMVDGRLRMRLSDKPLAWSPGHVAPSAVTLNKDSTVVIGRSADSFDHDTAFSYGAWVRLTKNNTGGAILAKMDEDAEHRGFDLWLENNRIGAHIIHSWPENAVKVVANSPLEKDRWHHVMVTYDGSGKAAGVQLYVDGVRQAGRSEHSKSLSETIRNDTPLRLGGRSTGSIPDGVGVNDLRMYERLLSPAEVAELSAATRIAYLLAHAPQSRSAEQNQEIFEWWLPRESQPYRDTTERLAELKREEEQIRGRGTIAHIMTERDGPAEAFVLARGEYDLPGEKVAADVPAVFPPMPEDTPRNRMGLAKWLLSEEHPLTARVTVNRYWQEVFGVGLVESSGDFGITGELPSHPELLDWLAVEFRESGWDIKLLLRMYVTSATYRQSAAVTKRKLELDPANRLLSRGPRFRMDAEMIRDYMLAASDTLSGTIGGASVKPYQPEGVWEAVAMRGSNTRDYRQDTGESLYRRSMYTFWKRSAPPASMDIFNAPSREVCTVQRDRTNTPLQALSALNDPQFIEAARSLAAIAMREGSDSEVRIDTMAKRLLARSLEENEASVVSQSLDVLLEHYEGDQEAAAELIAVGESPPPGDLPVAELAAYTLIANQLMNLDEVLSK